MISYNFKSINLTLTLTECQSNEKNSICNEKGRICNEKGAFVMKKAEFVMKKAHL